MPLKSIGKFQYESTGQVTILWNILLTSQKLLETATEYPMGNAAENPRCFLRCRFLVCSLLPLGKHRRADAGFVFLPCGSWTEGPPEGLLASGSEGSQGKI